MRSPLLRETDRRLDPQAASWDAFVEATPGGDLAQTSAWGRSKRAIGLGTRLVVVRDGSGKIAGGALIHHRARPGATIQLDLRGSDGSTQRVRFSEVAAPRPVAGR